MPSIMDELIYRRLEGNASAEDEEALLRWIDESDENRKHYVHCVRMHAELQKKNIELNKASALKNIKQQISKQTDSQSKPAQHYRFRNYAVAIAAAAAVIVALVIFSKPPQAPTIAEVIYTSDSLTDIVLSDSSKVFLNAGSKLFAEEVFSGNERRVALKGNGFFEVAKNPDVPFIINVGHVEVKVLGTSFDIIETAESVKVSVATGKVQVMDTATNETRILTKNRQCLFVKDCKAGEVTELADQNYLAWHTGVLSFSNYPLKDAINLINNHYDKNIELGNKEMADCPFSSKFDHTSFKDVLTVLQIAFDAEIDSTNKDAILLKGVSCY